MQALVAELLQRCSDAGDIYKANYEGYYCVDCEEYKASHCLRCWYLSATTCFVLTTYPTMSPYRL